MRMRENIRFTSAVLVMLAASVALVCANGCQSKTGTGALIGGAAGAGIGGLASRSATGAAIGGAVGAGAGALIGHAAEQQQSRYDNEQQPPPPPGQQPPPPPPEQQPPPPPPEQQGNTVIINVTNSNGSVTPVRMTRQGSGWVGPKGEYYSSLPTPEQLRPIYGF